MMQKAAHQAVKAVQNFQRIRRKKMSERTLKVGGKYKHFKGNIYEVLCIAKHSETQESLVVYKQLYGDGSVWVRPLDMFLEKVNRDGKTFFRFEEITE
jgi:hypothetical protein